MPSGITLKTTCKLKSSFSLSSQRFLRSPPPGEHETFQHCHLTFYLKRGMASLFCLCSSIHRFIDLGLFVRGGRCPHCFLLSGFANSLGWSLHAHKRFLKRLLFVSSVTPLSCVVSLPSLLISLNKIFSHGRSSLRCTCLSAGTLSLPPCNAYLHSPPAPVYFPVPNEVVPVPLPVSIAFLFPPDCRKEFPPDVV